MKFLEENGNIISLIERLNQHCGNYLNEEKMILKKLNKETIKFLFESKISQERKIRILSQFLKQSLNENIYSPPL